MWDVDVHGTGGVWRRRGVEERCVDLGNDVDCDGVLSLWVYSIILEKRESTEGGRVA